MPMPQPERRTAARQATSTALNALWVMLGLAAGTVMMVVVVAYGTARFKAGPPPATPLPPTAQVTRAAVPSVVTPSAAIMRPLPMPPQGRQVSAQRAADGHYYFDVTVGSTVVRTMFDTGASYVSLRAEDAARAGIAINSLDYNVRTQTANGVAEAAFVTLDSVRVGGITRWNVRALVSRPGKLGVTLLGQSFMSKLTGYRFERGELILQDD